MQATIFSETEKYRDSRKRLKHQRHGNTLIWVGTNYFLLSFHSNAFTFLLLLLLLMLLHICFFLSWPAILTFHISVCFSSNLLSHSFLISIYYNTHYPEECFLPFFFLILRNSCKNNVLVNTVVPWQTWV